MVQITMFWTKNGFRLGFWWFFMYVLQNPQIPDIYKIFENIGQKTGQFLQKMGPET